MVAGLVTVSTRLRKKFPKSGVLDGEVLSVTKDRCSIGWSDGSTRSLKLEIAAKYVTDGDENSEPLVTLDHVLTPTKADICAPDDSVVRRVRFTPEYGEEEAVYGVAELRELWHEVTTCGMEKRRPLAQIDERCESRVALATRVAKAHFAFDDPLVANEACSLWLKIATARDEDDHGDCFESIRKLGSNVNEGTLWLLAKFLKESSRALDSSAVVACDSAVKILASEKSSASIVCPALSVLANVFSRYHAVRSVVLAESVSLHKDAARPAVFKVCDRHYNNDDEKSTNVKKIRVGTALVMLLVQHALDEDDECKEKDGVPKIDTAMRTAKFFCTALIDRCRDSLEWRASTKLLVDDLVSVLVLPDWPAAETLARCFATILSSELKAQLPKKKGAVDLFAFFIDLLARIVAGVKRIQLRSARDEEEEQGIDVEERRLLPKKRKRKRQEIDVETLLAHQQLVFNAVRERAKAEPWMMNALRYHVVSSFARLPEDTTEDVRRHLASQYPARCHRTHGTSLNRGSWDAVLSARELGPIARLVLVASSGLFAAVASFVALLARQLTRENASLRARAMRALDEVVRADPSLMSDDTVRATLTSRFRDEAISVRQAAAELVGAHGLASSWETYESYHGALLDRLSDRGISVRKSVIRILRFSLQANATHAVHTTTLAVLIERASDIEEEETIKELILNTVRDTWFAREPECNDLKRDEEQPAAKRTRSALVGAATDLPDLDKTTRQIIDVVAGSASTRIHTNDDWAANVIQSALQGGRGAEPMVKIESASKGSREERRLDVAVERASRHVKAMVEHLLRLDELRHRLPTDDETKVRTVELRAASAADVVATMTTLRTFSRARPSLVATHLLVLAPYLRGDNGLTESQEGAVCCMVTETIAACLDSLSGPEASRVVSAVVPDLVGILHRFGSAPVAAAVRCLVVMARFRCGSAAEQARDELSRLVSSYYDALNRCSKEGAAYKSIAARASVVLGIACRSFSDGLIKVIGSKFVDAVFKLLTSCFLAAESDAATQARLVTAVADIVAGTPRYAAALLKGGTLTKMFGHSNDYVRAKALRAWARVVDVAAAVDLTEEDACPNLAFDNKSTDSAYLVAGATQALMPQVLASMHQGSTEARAASLALLSAVLRHGLVNPLDAIPKIIASLGDASKSISNDAARLLYYEHEKRPRYVSARFVEGIVLCFRLRKSRSSGCEDDAGLLQSLSAAYVRCIHQSKSFRNGVLRRLVGLFEPQHLAILPDTTALITALPFASCEEPLSLIYHTIRQMALIRDDNVIKLLHDIKTNLQSSYRISDARIETYIPK